MITCVTDIRAELGECPVWSPAEHVVYWIDIHGRKLHRTTPSTRTTESMDLPSRPGMIALRKKGGLVVVFEDGLYACDPTPAPSIASSRSKPMSRKTGPTMASAMRRGDFGSVR